MATEKLTMRKIRAVLKLHHEKNLSNREVGPVNFSIVVARSRTDLLYSRHHILIKK